METINIKSREGLEKENEALKIELDNTTKQLIEVSETLIHAETSKKELETALFKLQDEIDTYKYLVIKLQKSDHEISERKRLLIDITGINKPYTVSKSEIIKEIEKWLQ